MKIFAHLRQGDNFTVDGDSRVYEKNGLRSGIDKNGNTITVNTRDYVHFVSWQELESQSKKKSRSKKTAETEELELSAEEKEFLEHYEE